MDVVVLADAEAVVPDATATARAAVAIGSGGVG
jgi:hypothetical protein